MSHMSGRKDIIQKIATARHKLDNIDFKQTHIKELFGSSVFSESVQRDRLAKTVFKALQATVKKGEPLQADIADAVASAMKDWAIEKGATHYTHWFQPLTGTTAEKHDAFSRPTITAGCEQ